MNALSRFLSTGMQDADRRVAATLAPAPLEPLDRYLGGSAIVTAIDRATQHLADWWFASEASRLIGALSVNVLPTTQPASYRPLALILLIAAAVHVSLVLIAGPRPGWFWLVIPGMVALFAVLVIAGSRSSASVK